LKGLAKSVDGAGFAFTHLELPGKDGEGDAIEEKFGNIDALEPYVHLRYVNLSNHMLQNPGPLVKMSHLLSLNLSKNRLTAAGLESFRETPLKFLQVLDLSENLLENYSLDFPMLRELYLNKNQLNDVKLIMEGSVLKLLDLRDNGPIEPPPAVSEGEEQPPLKGLQDCDGFGVPSLETLLLTGNPNLKSLNGLQTLTGVTELDLSGNGVESLDGLPTNGKLSKLLMKDCKIAAWEELDKLTALTTVIELDVEACPLPGLTRGRILMRVPGLKILDRLPIREDDTEAAKQGDPAPSAEE